MNVQCVLGCMKKIQILRNGYNVQMKIVRCGVMQNVWKCVKMLMFVLFVKHYFYELVSVRKLVKHKLITAITVAIYIMLYMLYIYFVFVVHYTNKVKCMMFKMLNAWANKTILTKLP